MTRKELEALTDQQLRDFIAVCPKFHILSERAESVLRARKSA